MRRNFHSVSWVTLASIFLYYGTIIVSLQSLLCIDVDCLLTAMKLMTAIVDIAVTVERAKDNAKRQYESEKSKHQSKKASERLTALQHKKSEVYMIMTKYIYTINGSY